MKIVIFLFVVEVFVNGNVGAAATERAMATTELVQDGNSRLLLGKKDALCVYNLKTQEADCSKTDPTGVQVLDFHFTNSTVFYKSNGQGIKRIHLPLSEHKEESVSINSFENVTAMVIDWVNDNLYWNYNNTKLVRTDIQGQNATVLITCEQLGTFVTAPFGTVYKITNPQLDPYEEYIFIKSTFALNEKETSELIVRMNMDGTNPVTVCTVDNSSLVNFNIAVNEKMLYIKQQNQIHVCRYDGIIIKTFTLNLPVGIKASDIFHVALNNSYILGSGADQNEFSYILKGKIKYDNSVEIYPQMSRPGIDHMTSLKVLDVRVQRQMKNGTYVCEKDCEDHCEVLIPQGDTCFFSVFSANVTLLQECGRSDLTKTAMMTVMVNGTISDQANFPWFAILYKRASDDSWEANCGGTLITRRIVLTAAHCVTDENGKEKPTPMRVQDLRIALGKVYRLWNVKENFEERREVKEIMTHWGYHGSAYLHAHDIALLVLETSVPVTKYVMPACIDIKFKHGDELRTNKALQGYVPGMGNTKDCVDRGGVCKDASDQLRYYKGSIVDNDECFRKSSNMKYLPDNEVIFFTADMFCIGNGTGSPIQKGDSGGGMTFVFGGLHYVYGVVSNQMVNKKTLESTTFGSLTNVSVHMEWILPRIQQ